MAQGVISSSFTALNKLPLVTIQKDLRSFDRYSKKSSNEDLQNLLEEKITSDELSKF